MKTAKILFCTLILGMFLPIDTFAEDPLVPCQEGYTYVCDEYGLCGCEPSGGSGGGEGSSSPGYSMTLNYDRIRGDSLLESPFYSTLIGNGYSESDAEYIIGLIHAYGEEYGAITLDKSFKNYLRRNELSKDDIQVVFDGLAALDNDAEALEIYYHYELVNVQIVDF